MSEYLYIIRCHEFTKIGIAGNVKNRLKTLQTGNPYRLELIDSFEFDDVLRVESILHRKYDHAWVIGEWFKLTDSEFEGLMDICKNFDESKVELPDQSMACRVLESALSYCAEAGIKFDVYNADGRLIIEIENLNYVNGEIVYREKSEA
jgi:Meiotically Up-regulated Gene 113 (MUG113) protein